MNTNLVRLWEMLHGVQSRLEEAARHDPNLEPLAQRATESLFLLEQYAIRTDQSAFLSTCLGTLRTGTEVLPAPDPPVSTRVAGAMSYCEDWYLTPSPEKPSEEAHAR